jgi:hypothetical protein
MKNRPPLFFLLYEIEFKNESFLHFETVLVITQGKSPFTYDTILVNKRKSHLPVHHLSN